MKRKLFVFALVALTGMTAWAGDVITRNTAKLPAAAREVLQKHFPKAPVSFIKIDSELLGGTTYEVVLTTGTEVEFDAKGNWKEVDCKKGNVPDTMVPSSIRTFLKTEYPDVFVEKIERTRRTYEVDLSNGLDLVFDLQGRLRKVDD